MDADEAWYEFRKSSVLGKLDTIASQLNDIKTDTERTAKLVPKILGDENAVDAANASADNDALNSLESSLGGASAPEGGDEGGMGGEEETEDMSKEEKPIEKSDDSDIKEEAEEKKSPAEAPEEPKDSEEPGEGEIKDDAEPEEEEDEELTDEELDEILASLENGPKFREVPGEGEGTSDEDDEDIGEGDDSVDKSGENDPKLKRIMELQSDLNEAISDLISDRITKGDSMGGARIANAFAGFEKSWHSELNRSIGEVYGMPGIFKSSAEEDCGIAKADDDASAPADSEGIVEKSEEAAPETGNEAIASDPIEACRDVAKSMRSNIASFQDMMDIFKSNARPPMTSWAKEGAPAPPEEVRDMMGISKSSKIPSFEEIIAEFSKEKCI